MRHGHWLLVASIAMSGCATDECEECADDGAGGKADETHPTASTGTLKVNVLPGSASTRIFAKRQDADASILQPGIARQLVPGLYCVWTEIGSEALGSDCTADIQALVATTYDLGSIEVVHGRDERVFELDLRPPHQLAYELGRATQPIAHAAGTPTYTLNPASPVRLAFQVAQGTTSVVDVTALPDMRAVRLLPSTGRVLPNATDPFPTFSACAIGLGPTRCEAYRPDSKPWLFIQGVKDRHVSVYSSVNQVIIPIEAFPTTSSIVDVQMRRIDLNHVAVTLANGTVQHVPGSATITLAVTASGVPYNKIIVAQHPTGYGIDVPPAKYLVTTTFTHPADNSTLSVDETLDLR